MNRNQANQDNEMNSLQSKRWVKTNAPSAGRRVTGSKTALKGDDDVLAYCKEEGHWAKECPKKL